MHGNKIAVGTPIVMSKHCTGEPNALHAHIICSLYLAGEAPGVPQHRSSMRRSSPFWNPGLAQMQRVHRASALCIVCPVQLLLVVLFALHYCS
ncbi:uncharacterized protein CANTADRAFT_326433 [Suhomyces tanzawaensis NRRL Y-17324]|uniref:Uncharacterized protein n=1 Tax=Suhomyces tanzawaensis NRRL Y-17324 TaxID=984487 RepID=A0A1E4SC66_9ASCO|nr:uncharacterized protein CANTADRAFT_326433 [Suhomyces tanzawaensis NRRL Y-17324]ODV77101.1 hypothetical protein CANTADRAFT_326433 [Suhomyces tanzawaensis NRRL Y-17324]